MSQVSVETGFVYGFLKSLDEQTWKKALKYNLSDQPVHLRSSVLKMFDKRILKLEKTRLFYCGWHERNWYSTWWAQLPFVKHMNKTGVNEYEFMKWFTRWYSSIRYDLINALEEHKAERIIILCDEESETRCVRRNFAAVISKMLNPVQLSEEDEKLCEAVMGMSRFAGDFLIEGDYNNTCRFIYDAKTRVLGKYFAVIFKSLSGKYQMYGNLCEEVKDKILVEYVSGVGSVVT